MIALGWMIWVVLFLAYELPAAVAEVYYAKRRGEHREITLSRNVWRWTGRAKGQEWRPFRGLRSFAFAQFGVVVFVGHLAYGWPEGTGVIISGIPVGIVIIRGLYEDKLEKKRVRMFTSGVITRYGKSGKGWK